MTSDKTYDFKGEKEISVKGTSGAKKRITVLLTVSSNGWKYPPYIIFKSKNKCKKQKNDYPSYCIIRENENGWMTDNLFIGNILYYKNFYL